MLSDWPALELRVELEALELRIKVDWFPKENSGVTPKPQ